MKYPSSCFKRNSLYLFICGVVVGFFAFSPISTAKSKNGKSEKGENDQKGTPVLQFDRSDLTYDLGDLQQYEEKKFKIAFTNTGDAELEILDIAPSCGCTVVRPEKTKFASGEHSELNVTFSVGNHKMGEVMKTILIESNDPVHKKVTLTIKGYVHVSLALEPSQLAFGRIAVNDKGKSLFSKLIGEDNVKYDVTAVDSSGDYFSASFIPAGEESTTPGIKVSLLNLPPPGLYRETITLHTTHPTIRTLPLYISAFIRYQIESTPSRLIFKASPVASHPIIALKLTSQTEAPFAITSWEITQPGQRHTSRPAESKSLITLSKEDIVIMVQNTPATFPLESKHGSLKLSVKLKRNIAAGEKMRGVLVLHTNNEEQPELLIPLFAFSTIPALPK